MKKAIQLSIAFLLLTSIAFGQENMSGLYWVSASGAVYSTQEGDDRRLFRAETYIYLQQDGNNLTLDWGGFFDIIGDTQLKGSIGNKLLAVSSQADNESHQLTANITEQNKLMGRYIHIRNTSQNAGWTTIRFRAVRIDNSCIPIETNALNIKTNNDKKTLLSGVRSIATFTEREDAVITQKVLKQYKISDVCSIIPPYPSAFILQSMYQIPEADTKHSTCTAVIRPKIRLVSDSGKWIVTDGEQNLITCKSKEEGLTIIALIRYHKLNNICYSNKENASFVYLMK